MSKFIKKVCDKPISQQMIEHCNSGLSWDNCKILGYVEHPNEVTPFVEFEMVSTTSVVSDAFDYEKFSHIDDEGCVHFETPMSSTFIFSRCDLDKMCKLFGCEVKEK